MSFSSNSAVVDPTLMTPSNGIMPGTFGLSSLGDAAIPQPNFFERLDAGFTKLNQSPLFQFGMRMLDNGGPSATPHSFGQDLARSVGQFPAGVTNAINMGRQSEAYDWSSKLWDKNINPATMAPYPQAPMLQTPAATPTLSAPPPAAPAAAPAPAQTASGAVAAPQQAAPAPATPPPTPVPGYQSGQAAAAGLPQTPLSPNYNGPPLPPYQAPVSAPPMMNGQPAPVATGAPQQLGISPTYNADLKAGENPNYPRGSWNGPDNGSTTARGDYQIVEGTWRNAAKRAGVDPDSPNPSAEDQDKVLEVLKEDDAKRLKANDLPVNDTNMKVLHILGPKGIALLKAKESTPADMVVGKEAIANNPGLFRQDGGKGKIRTVGEVKDHIEKKYKASDEQVQLWQRVGQGSAGPIQAGGGGQRVGTGSDGPIQKLYGAEQAGGGVKQPDSVTAASEAGMAPTQLLQAYTQMPADIKQNLLLGAMYASGGDRVAFAQNFGKAIMEYYQDAGKLYQKSAGSPGGMEITGGGVVALMPNGETRQLVMTDKGYMEQYLDNNGRVAFRPPPNGWRPTVPSTGGYLSPMHWTKLKRDLETEREGLVNLQKYFNSVATLKPGAVRWANSLRASIKNFFGNSNLSPEEYEQQYAKAKAQAMIGANRLDFLGPGTVTEYDADRIIAAIGGMPDSAWQNPETVQRVLMDLWESKQRRARGFYNDYVTNLHVYSPGAVAESWNFPEKLEPKPIPGQDGKTQTGTPSFAPDENGVWRPRTQ